MVKTSFLVGALAVGVVASLYLSGPDISGHAYIIDGDTLVINHKHIRLWGIDAPEMDQPYGPQARQNLRTITLDKDVICNYKSTDRYARVVAKCEVSGVDLGHIQVSFGLAWDWTRYSGSAYATEQSAAQRDHRGLWLDPSPTAPWEWRQQHQKSH